MSLHAARGWREGHAICIALAGARATGKSLYIAVLVKQLELLCERFGVSMQPVTRGTAQAYATNYETPLYVQRGLIPPTPTVRTQTSDHREPLMFSLGIWHGVRRFLVLRDVAGEDMESGDLHAPPFRFFAHADAVFFMFDPLRVKTIRDQLHDLLPAQVVSGGDPRTVLTNVLTAVSPGQPKLAVILSKFDVLRALRDVEGSEWGLIMSNGGAAYLRDTSDGQQYDETDGQLLHEEVRSLLLRLHGGSILAAVENPATGVRLQSRNFVVSALGHPPREIGCTPGGSHRSAVSTRSAGSPRASACCRRRPLLSSRGAPSRGSRRSGSGRVRRESPAPSRR